VTPPRPPAPKAGPSATVVLEEKLEWETIASGEDADRLLRLDSAWKSALGDAQRRNRRAVAAEGELLDPAAALPRPDPSPGSYRCRLVRLGGQAGEGPAFAAYKPFFCYVGVEGELLTLTKQTGSQRPAGFLYPDRDKQRLIFLGTLALGGDEAPAAYGEDAERNLIGVLERVAPFRFRLVIPSPKSESILDVMELVPAVE
jgi:Domain of unknown function (DUF4893)